MPGFQCLKVILLCPIQNIFTPPPWIVAIVACSHCQQNGCIGCLRHQNMAADDRNSTVRMRNTGTDTKADTISPFLSNHPYLSVFGLTAFCPCSPGQPHVKSQAAFLAGADLNHHHLIRIAAKNFPFKGRTIGQKSHAAHCGFQIQTAFIILDLSIIHFKIQRKHPRS